MSHLTFQTLLDYIEDKLPQPERLRVESHLADCGVCREELDAAKSMMHGLEKFHLSAPAPNLVQRTLAAFRRQQQQLTERIAHAATLQFDSKTMSMAFGTRGAAQEHQLLYSFNPFDLDIQISHDPASNTSTLHGQLLSQNEEEQDMMGIQLRLSSTDADTDPRLGITDELGRFSFAYLADGDYSLHISFETHDLVIDPLTITH